MKKRVVSLLLALGMCFGLTACGQGDGGESTADNGGSSSTETITVRIATQHPDDYPSSQAMMKLAEDLEERSGGVLQCDVYTNNALGGELDILDQARTGTVEIIYCSPTAATMNPKINVFDLPFLFENYEQVEKVVSNEELMNEILGEFVDYGIRPMAAYENGLRVISSNKKIESLADLKGMAVDNFLKMLKGVPKAIATFISVALQVAFIVVMFLGILEFLPTAAQQFSPVLRLDMAMIYSIFLISSVLMLLGLIDYWIIHRGKIAAYSEEDELLKKVQEESTIDKGEA